MPIIKCSSDGKSGWKYGDSGHCYTGPDAKKKAAIQGFVIRKNSGEASELSTEELEILLTAEELTLLERTELSLKHTTEM